MSLRRLSRNALASMVQVVGSTFLLIEFYRFLVRQLGPEQIGVWSLVVASTAAVRLGEMGIGSAVVRFVAGDLGARQTARAASTLAMCVVAVGVPIAILCLLLWPALDRGLALVIHDAGLLGIARSLLPLSLTALWLGSIAQVLLSALDAMQRTDLKAVVTLGAGAGQLAVAYAVVPTQGLHSLAFVQLVHSALSAAVAIALVAATLGIRISDWFRWDRRRLVAMFRYGGGVQLGSIGQLLFEPTVKALLSVFGGLSSTGYYELANRATTQYRSVIVAAYQLLIPYLAHRAGDRDLETKQIINAYRFAHGLLVALVLPYFGLLAAAMPLVLSLWLGRYEPAFVAIGLACVLGWGLNTLAVSAYTIYLAIGRLRWTLWAQLAVGVSSVVFASLGGWGWGSLGVVIGAMLALTAGSAVVTWAFHTEFSVSWREFLPAGSIPVASVSLLGAMVLAGAEIVNGDPIGSAVQIVAGLALFAVICGLLVWRDPAVAHVIGRLRRETATL